MDPTKPGSQTTEFKLTVVSSLVSAVIGLIALFSPGFTITSEAQGLICSIAVAAVTLATSVYSASRSRLKASALQADATVKASPLGAQAMLPNGTQLYAANQVEPHEGGQF